MPYLGSTVFVSTAVVALLVSLLASMTLARALFAQRVTDTARALEARPKASAATGTVVILVAGVVLSVLLTSPASRPLGLLSLAALLGFMCIGLAAVAQLVGTRLKEDDGYRTTLRGGLALLLSCLLPLVGWFLVLPISLLAATGAGTLSLFGVGKQPAPNHNVAPPYPYPPAHATHASYAHAPYAGPRP